MVLVDYEIEKQIFLNDIQNSMNIIVDIETQESYAHELFKKIILQKKKLKQIQKFQDFHVELYKKRDGIYSFYSCDLLFDYSIKRRRIKYPGKIKWLLITSRTLEGIINNDFETIYKLSLRK
jgi:hypothetical protein